MNGTKKTLLAALAVGIVSAPLIAGAHGGGKEGRGMRMFELLDADGDRVITRVEINEKRKADLAKFDADGNGALSLAEYEKLWLERMRERMVRSFQKFDADGDASITDAELARRADRMLMRMDTDGDGNVTVEELRERRGHRARAKHGERHRRGHRDARHHERHGAKGDGERVGNRFPAAERESEDS